MSKIKEYQVVTETGIVDINCRINDLIQEGWEPIGGVSSTVTILPGNGGNAIIVDFSQAMIKYEDRIKIG